MEKRLADEKATLDARAAEAEQKLDGLKEEEC